MVEHRADRPRKSSDSLSALVKRRLSEDLLSGHFFVFINRRGSQMKILYFDHSSYVIWSKRLEQGRFVTRPKGRTKQALSFAELQCLRVGIETPIASL
ncbi:MAG: IS66 family insertion sequence element accessory protein TnpB [Candidatus Thiodiazotropha sp.]